MTGLEFRRPKPLKIGEIELANRVLLAPMSGVTDAPFRRLAARLGAGLVVSEMTASDDLVNGKPMSVTRWLQYFGTFGSISSDHAVIPPFTLLTYLNPCSRRKRSAFMDRIPLLQ